MKLIHTQEHAFKAKIDKMMELKETQIKGVQRREMKELYVYVLLLLSWYDIIQFQ